MGYTFANEYRKKYVIHQTSNEFFPLFPRRPTPPFFFFFFFEVAGVLCFFLSFCFVFLLGVVFLIGGLG